VEPMELSPFKDRAGTNGYRLRLVRDRAGFPHPVYGSRSV
jgi:hypothetical protein